MTKLWQVPKAPSCTPPQIISQFLFWHPGYLIYVYKSPCYRVFVCYQIWYQNYLSISLQYNQLLINKAPSMQSTKKKPKTFYSHHLIKLMMKMQRNINIGMIYVRVACPWISQETLVAKPNVPSCLKKKKWKPNLDLVSS